jgi:hypothetical protein
MYREIRTYPPVVTGAKCLGHTLSSVVDRLVRIVANWSYI